MKLSNYKLLEYITDLKPFLSRTDEIGYACALNTSRMNTVAEPFLTIRDTLVRQYGTIEVDENGKQTGRCVVTASNPEFEKFKSEIDKIGNIEQEVDIYTIPASLVKNVLSGSEILDLIWMIDE